MSGPAKPFLDTNVLIYAFASNDPRGPKAEAVLAGGGTVSVQVLNEFVAVCRRKLRVDWPVITRALGVIRDLTGEPLPLTVATHERALALAQQHGLAIYDSLIIASAELAGCKLLYSEDLQHGRNFGSLLVRNPFAGAPP